MPPAQGLRPSPDPYGVVRRLLADATACPSCSATLTSTRCGTCGLDLAGADARELWSLSQRAVGALDARQAHLAGMLGRQRQAAEAQHRAPAATAARGHGAAPQSRPSAGPAPAPTGPRLGHSGPPAPPRVRSGPPAPVAPSPSTAAPGPRQDAGRSPLDVPPPPPRAPRRHWRVQTVLQVLGASLLAAASIVFLLFSWGWIPLVGRAVAVAVGTVVVFAVASRLRRSGLTSSAEAVGGLAAVLLLLDAWAVPATGLLRPAEPAVYAGVSALVCGAALAAWGLRARLRVGTLAGAVLVPVAPLLLAPVVPSAGGFAGLACVALALTTARFVGRAADPDRHTLERAVLAGLAWVLVAVLALVAAVASLVDGTAWDAPDAPAWGSVAALVAGSVLAALQGRLAVQRHGLHADDTSVAAHAALPGAPDAPGAPPTFAGLGGAARAWTTVSGALAAIAGLAVAALLVRAGAAGAWALWALVPLAPTLVTLGLRLTRRGRAPWAAHGAHAVGLLASVPTAAALPLVVAASVVDPALDPGPATTAALVLGAAATVALTRAAGRQAGVGSWIAVAVLVGVPVALASAWPGLGGTGLVLLLVLLAALVFTGDAVGRRPVLDTSAPARTVVVVAVLGALAASQGTPGPLAAALAAAAGLSAGTRWWVARPVALRGVALAAGVLLGWSASVVALVALGVDPAVARTATAVAVVAGSAVLAVRRAGSPQDRVAWLAAGVTALVTAWPWAFATSAPGGPGPLPGLLVLLAAVALAGSARVAVRGRRVVPASARVAAAGVAPLGALSVVSLENALGPSLPGSTLAVGIAAAGAVGVLLAPVLARGAAADDAPRLGAAAEAPGHDEHARRAAEGGGWAALAAAVATASGSAPTGSAATAALVLLVAAITAGAWSLSPGRRWARWWTLVLATVASWVLLVTGDVGTPEAYLAPAGLVLAVVGARRWRSAADGDVALLGAGLALATVPSALLDGELAGIPRDVAVGAVGAALVGLLGIPSVRRRPGAGTGALRPAHVLSLLGGLLAVLGPWRHALSAAQLTAPGGPGGPWVVEVEAWSLPAAAVLGAAAWRLARDPSGTRLRAAVWGAWAVAAASVVPTVVAVRDSGDGLVRTLVVLAAGSALALGTARRTSAARERADLAVVGLAVAGLGALGGSTTLTQPPGDVLVAVLGLLALAVAVRRAGGANAPWWGTAGAVLVLPLALQDEVWRGAAAGALSAVLVGCAALVRRTSDDGAEVERHAAAASVRRSEGAPRGASEGAAAVAGPHAAPGAEGMSTPAPAHGEEARRGVLVSTRTLLLVTAGAMALLGPARLATTAAGGPVAGLTGVEAWSLVASLLLAGALRELTHRAAPVAATARHAGVWLVAAVAAVPTAVAVTAPTSSSLSLARTLALLAVGAAVAVVGVTGAAPPRRVLGTSLVALGLAVAGLAWLASAAAPAVPPPGAVLAAVGLLVAGVGAVVVARSDPGASWPFLGALLVLPLVLTPAPWGGTVVGLLVAAVALGAGAITALARGVTARTDGAPPAGSGERADGTADAGSDARTDGTAVPGSRTRAGAVPLSVAALLAGAVAVQHTADAVAADAGLRVELVALGAAGVLGVALVLLARAWPVAGPSPRSWGAWPVAVAAAGPSLAAAVDDPADLGRPGAALALGSLLAVAGAARAARAARGRGGPSVPSHPAGAEPATVSPSPGTAPVDAGAAGSGGAPASASPAALWGVRATQVRAVGLAVAAAAALVAVVRGGVVPVDAPLVLLGATLLAVGVLALRSDPVASSWVCLAPGLVLGLVVPVTTGWWEPTMWRLVLVLVGATAAVVVGAARRWQAPFVLGGAALAVLAVVQVSPAAAAAMQVVEWWVVLALGGAVLLGLGLTYERRLREAREAARFVIAMR